MGYRFSRAAGAASILAATALGATAVFSPTLAATAEQRSSSVNANSQLACVAQNDAAGIDAILSRAGSPLAGSGKTFVEAGTEAGIDPRFIVAVAAHETMLMTYGPSQRINNPFGLGPGMAFAHHDDAIRFAARLLARNYVGEGRPTIPLIGSKWAPVGASNDPTNLNQAWPNGVSRYFATLGGNPYQPVTIARQQANTCASGTAPVPNTAQETPSPQKVTPDKPVAPPAEGSGPSQIVVWDKTPPVVKGKGALNGVDPASGTPAQIDGFVFPLAVPANGGVRYRVSDCEAGAPCITALESAPLAHVTASISGTLASADDEDLAAGIGFWIVSDSGERIGYGALAAYHPGIQEGTRVEAGQILGRSTGTLTFTWTRGDTAINAGPLLKATRPPTG